MFERVSVSFKSSSETKRHEHANRDWKKNGKFFKIKTRLKNEASFDESKFDDEIEQLNRNKKWAPKPVNQLAHKN